MARILGWFNAAAARASCSKRRRRSGYLFILFEAEAQKNVGSTFITSTGPMMHAPRQTAANAGCERIAPGAGKQALLSWTVRPSLHLTDLTSFKSSPLTVLGRSTVGVAPLGTSALQIDCNLAESTERENPR